MDVLWSPWRYDYIKASGGTVNNGCVFCSILSNSASDEENFILKRAELNFVILNIYPYTSGHLMIVPYEHVDRLHKLPAGASVELMELTCKLESVLFDLYRPDGANIGMNIGKAAGAGIAGHIHMHALPRWVADANFISVIGETRILPEDLETTYRRLKQALS